MVERVITFVLGVSSGCTVWQFTPQDTKQVLEAEIPWGIDGDKIYWPMAWLRDILGAAKNYVGNNALFIGGMPGADLVHLITGRYGAGYYPARHYRSVPQAALDKVLAEVAALDLYLATGGANVAPFQPHAQLVADQREWRGVGAIVPLCDLLTLWLTQGKFQGHDPIMLQSQGLKFPKSKAVSEKLFGAEKANKITPWRVFKFGESHKGIFPMSHDSVYSRLVGFTKCPAVIWTGSWLGVAISLRGRGDFKPSRETFRAGIAFEGIDWTRAAITNSGMFGVIYKALLAKAGLKYDQVYEAIGILWESAQPFDKWAEMPPEEEKAVDWLLDCYRESDLLTISGFIKGVARKCYEDLIAASKALKIDPPQVIALTGGWAKNKRLIEVLESLGLKVYVPPFATNATHAGLAAFALSGGKSPEEFETGFALLQEWAKEKIS